MSLIEDIAIPLIAVVSAMLFFWILKSCARNEPEDAPKSKPRQIYAIVLNPSGSLRLGKMGLGLGRAVVGEETVISASLNNTSTTGGDGRSESQGEETDRAGGGDGAVAVDDRDARNGHQDNADELV